ncbi:MAG TPA: helix-turn-helix domain-containing protein [Ktedonobacterales bacterium]|jgi:excisionase family DNA binding protein
MEPTGEEVIPEEPHSKRPPRLLLTPKEAANALGISRASLYPLLMRKEIPSVRVGGLRRVPLGALQRYIDELLSA